MFRKSIAPKYILSNVSNGKSTSPLSSTLMRSSTSPHSALSSHFNQSKLCSRALSHLTIYSGLALPQSHRSTIISNKSSDAKRHIQSFYHTDSDHLSEDARVERYKLYANNITLEQRKAMLVDYVMSYLRLDSKNIFEMQKAEACEKFIHRVIKSKNKEELIHAYDSLKKAIEIPDKNIYLAGVDSHLMRCFDFLILDKDDGSIFSGPFNLNNLFDRSFNETTEGLIHDLEKRVEHLKGSLLLILEELNANKTWLPIVSTLSAQELGELTANIIAAKSESDLVKTIYDDRWALKLGFNSWWSDIRYLLQCLDQRKDEAISQPFGRIGQCLYLILDRKQREKMTLTFPERHIKLLADLERWAIIEAIYQDDERWSAQRYFQGIYGSLYPTNEQINKVIVEKLNKYALSGNLLNEVKNLEEFHQSSLKLYLSSTCAGSVAKIKADLIQNNIALPGQDLYQFFRANKNCPVQEAKKLDECSERIRNFKEISL